ncbi:MAG TPA: hypothetical protein V6C81_26370 [Planktothrix sp.]|jgi:hypothetical protein
MRKLPGSSDGAIKYCIRIRNIALYPGLARLNISVYMAARCHSIRHQNRKMFEPSVQSLTHASDAPVRVSAETADSSEGLMGELHAHRLLAECAGAGIAVLGALALAKTHLLPAAEDVLPQFDDLGRLPKGRYTVDFDRFAERFIDTTDRRRILGNGIIRALHELKDAGATRVEIGGSFVSDSPFPGDFDMVWLDKKINDRNFSDSMLRSQVDLGGHIFPAEAKFNDIKWGKSVRARDLMSMHRDGSRFGTVILDLRQELPEAPPLSSVKPLLGSGLQPFSMAGASQSSSLTGLLEELGSPSFTAEKSAAISQALGSRQLIISEDGMVSLAGRPRAFSS